MLLILLFLIFCEVSIAQKKILIDTAAIFVRNIPAASINKYKNDDIFRYERVVEPGRSYWDRFWVWFWGKFNSILKTETGRRTFNILLIMSAVSILVFFILKISGMNNTGLFGKKNTTGSLDYSVMDEDIHAINFEAAIQQAIFDKNYKFAVRLLYLQTLKNLTDRSLIKWEVNKTNIAYVQELDGNTSQDTFSKLTFQFENNWYGDLPIDANEFKGVFDQFNQFNLKIS